MGPARELDKQYNTPYLDLQVAYALVQGILQDADVPAEVWPYLEQALAFYRGLADDRPRGR